MEEEEGDGITPTVGSSPPPPPPPAVSETLSAGSVEDPGFHNAAEAPPPDDSSSEGVVVLTDDLKEKIIRQVEYYFSDENLPTDKFLLKHVKKDKDGFVPVAVVASFRKMKKLVPNKSLIVTALRESLQLVLSSDGKRVRRINPLPVTEIKDTKACTVIVENLPQDCSTENLQKIFGDVGNVKSISIRVPQALEGSTKSSKAERPISGKMHALVEYETAKEAEKAVAALKNVQSWRNDMRVELLLKWTDKYGIVAKNGRKGGGSEKNDNHPANYVAGNVPVNHTAGNDQNVKYIDTHETPEQEEAKHSANDKAGRSRRNRGRGRGQSSGQNQHNPNGHGHGSPPTSSRSEFVRKSPPGPRMPDGTKGFTMGRGRPPLSNHSPEE